MDTNFGTQFFEKVTDREDSVESILTSVYLSLEQKGYNPINQMVGYIMSGDPTYITSFENSRGKITRVNRDEIVEELLKTFVGYHKLGKQYAEEPQTDETAGN